jgi:endogenous inhibitor of DNA gyrase (YacG/DUF329 family)
MADLGRWLAEDYRVPGGDAAEAAPDEEDVRDRARPWRRPDDGSD